MEERMAANEVTFRDANETIQERARELEFQPPVPFLCECGAASCRAILRIPLHEYEDIRRRATTFLIAPDHEEVARVGGDIIDRRDGYLVVDKTGRSGEIAAEADPRAPSPRG